MKCELGSVHCEVWTVKSPLVFRTLLCNWTEMFKPKLQIQNFVSTDIFNTKPTEWPVHPVKTQSPPVWSVFGSLANDKVHREGSDRTDAQGWSESLLGA